MSDSFYCKWCYRRHPEDSLCDDYTRCGDGKICDIFGLFHHYWFNCEREGALDRMYKSLALLTVRKSIAYEKEEIKQGKLPFNDAT